ncbi:MAG: hypothetical protein JO290_09210 [Sphingomonadaceae bacterium]|nr:hypothetical protein [Sphingomonadaceae bacterium]
MTVTLARRTVLAAGAALAARPGLAAAPPPADDLSFDLTQVPLSCAGSFLTLTHDPANTALPLRLATVRKTAIPYRYQTGPWAHELLGIGFGPGAPVATPRATPAGAELAVAGAAARVRFVDAVTLRVEAEGEPVRIVTARGFSWQRDGGRRGFDNDSGYVIAVDGPAVHSAVTRDGGGAAEAFTIPPGTAATLRFAAEVEDLTQPPGLGAGPVDAWMGDAPTFAADDTPAKRHATRIAWFLFWNLQVAPAGGYGGTAILSSKRSLSAVWSWDNLFNALAVVRARPALAWAQLFLVLAHQRADGSLPDTVSDLRATYGFTKPPLWAWTVVQLLRHTPAGQRRDLLARIYPRLARFHDWWFAARDLRGDGVPAYLSGNDSGWDNSTVFDGGGPVQSPDLLALLALDAEHLGTIAGMLGDAAAARRWAGRARDHLDRFHAHFASDGALGVHVQTASGWAARASTSLLTRIPVLLGPRLRADVRRTLVAELGDPSAFAAPCGPASESLASPLYKANGYWRGPVWGPSTLLIVRGLQACGEAALARDLGDRYRATCARAATFRENYDARTGEGNDDGGMTWSAADYLLLAQS